MIRIETYWRKESRLLRVGKCRINVGNMSEMSDKILFQASPATHAQKSNPIENILN